MESVILALEQFFLSGSTFEIVLRLFVAGGWIVFVSLLFFSGFTILEFYKNTRLTKNWKYVLLAIDIPQENVQTPKAVEQLFSHIFSVMDPPAINTKYWRGFQQFQFSFEIISIEGYIQFLVRTLDKYQDVVEAAVYAQYPDVEITEVEDYVKGIPDNYPNETHKIWAADFVLTQHDAFPIRLYSEFEHSISKDTVLKDPMGTFLESFSRIGSGEQVWFQIIIEPLAEKKWKPACIKKIKELIGEKTESKGGLFSFLFDSKISKEIARSLDEVNAQVSGGIRGEEADTKSNDGPINNLLYLTPGQKTLVENMEKKISKIGFKTKMRGMYVARKEVYNAARAANSLVGAINQYNNPTSNAILPKYITSTRYMFKDYRDNYRRNLLMKAYKKRSPDMGLKQFMLNIEELATVWHFPMSHVKTPLVQKNLVRTSEPPIGLPLEGIASIPVIPTDEDENTDIIKSAEHMTDSGDVIHYDDFG